MNEIVAAAIGAAVSLLVSAIVNFRERSHFFSDTVSAERMKWVKDMRKLGAAMLSICEQYEPDDLSTEQYAAFLNARNGILIRLNPIDTNYPHDQALQRMLDSPDFATIKANVPQIRYHLGTILKAEWEKVKVEAGNNLWKLRQIDAARKKIEEERKKP